MQIEELIRDLFFLCRWCAVLSLPVYFGSYFDCFRLPLLKIILWCGNELHYCVGWILVESYNEAQTRRRGTRNCKRDSGSGSKEQIPGQYQFAEGAMERTDLWYTQQLIIHVNQQWKSALFLESAVGNQRARFLESTTRSWLRSLVDLSVVLTFLLA